jgi:hypothetical protein
MKRFLIETPHKAEDCLRVLDEELAKGPEVLEKFEYGCMAGDHTGYAIVDLNTREDAQKIVPSFLLSSAKIVEVGKYTPAMIRSFHTAKAA